MNKFTFLALLGAVQSTKLMSLAQAEVEYITVNNVLTSEFAATDLLAVGLTLGIQKE